MGAGRASEASEVLAQTNKPDGLRRPLGCGVCQGECLHGPDVSSALGAGKAPCKNCSPGLLKAPSHPGKWHPMAGCGIPARWLGRKGFSMRLALFLASVLWLPSPAEAHGGGLNAEGCHNNRKTGDYHCHRPQALPSRLYAQPARARGGSVEYANCTEARAAGAAPVKRGDPGYSRKLDRDGDGVGCE